MKIEKMKNGNRNNINILAVVLVMVFTAVVGFGYLSAAPLEEGEKIKVKKGEDTLFVFREQSSGMQWKANSTNYEMKITREAEGYKIKLGDIKYKLKKKTDSYKLYNPDGKLRFKVKIKAADNKIKISQSEDDPNPWSLKRSGSEKCKVKKGETEIGKVKYYPEKKKLKVKITDESEICSAKSDKLLVAPAVALFEELDEKDKLFLFAILSIIEE